MFVPLNVQNKREYIWCRLFNQVSFCCERLNTKKKVFMPQLLYEMYAVQCA